MCSEPDLWARHWQMGRAYSYDLRERVVRAVIKGGLSRHQAAAQFGVGISMAINWVQRLLRDRQRQAGPDRWWQFYAPESL